MPSSLNQLSLKNIINNCFSTLLTCGLSTKSIFVKCFGCHSPDHSSDYKILDDDPLVKETQHEAEATKNSMWRLFDPGLSGFWENNPLHTHAAKNASFSPSEKSLSFTTKTHPQVSNPESTNKSNKSLFT